MPQREEKSAKGISTTRGILARYPESKSILRTSKGYKKVLECKRYQSKGVFLKIKGFSLRMLTRKLQILYFPVQAKKSAIRLLTPRERFHIQSASPLSRSQGQTERRKSVRTPVGIVQKGFKFTNTDLYSSTKDTAIRFGAFSRLPPELRLIIWEYARPDPRIVRLLKSKHSSALYSKTPIPGILHATRESRAIALKWYQLCFPMRYPRLSLADWMRPNKIDFVKPRTYFDFTNDVLYIGCESCYSVYCEACKENILFLQDKIKVQRIILHNTIPTVFQILTPPRPFYDKTRFDWQNEVDLKTQYFASHKGNFPRLRRWFVAEEVRRMELDITAETSKIYGFMEERFRGMTFNLSYRKELGESMDF